MKKTRLSPPPAPSPSSSGWMRYLTAASAAMAVQPSAEAAIVYYNPVDVSVAQGSTKYIDFVNGIFTDTAIGLGVKNVVASASKDDVELPIVGSQVQGVAISVAYSSTGSASKFTLGQGINSNGGAYGFSATLDFDHYYFGGLAQWNSGVDGTTGYLGVKLLIGGQTKYGWVGVTYNDIANTVVLKDFAYENTSNSAIAAGAVPEPHGAVLLAMGAAGVLAQRRRKAAVANAADC